MKVRMELDESLDEIEIVIRAGSLTPELEQIQQALSQLSKTRLTFYKGSSEYFLEIGDILFFETDGPKIYAHSAKDAYEVSLKLYELEERLPAFFCRVAKSTIVNARAVYSLDKSFSGTSTISFHKTHKQVHVSRHYYQALKETLGKVRLYR